MLRLITLAAVAAMFVVLAPGAQAANSPPQRFTDPSGDAGTAADITSVDVSNDDQGQYTFDVTFATAYGDTNSFAFYLDTDQNPATGDPNAAGADYFFFDDHASHSFDLLKWSGTDWAEAPSSSTASVLIGADNLSLTASVNRSEIGDPVAFDFFVVSGEGDLSAGHFDDAPSGSGTWHYALQPVLQLSVVAFHSFAVKAGGTWSVALVAGRSDTSGTVGSEGTIVCRATVGTTKLALVSRAFVSGGSGKGSSAICAFKVPKKLKHKVLHAVVTVSLQGQSVSHSFTTTVK
jgi:hypothetical protein